MSQQNIYQEKVIGIKKYKQKIDSTGEPLVQQAFFLLSFDRTW